MAKARRQGSVAEKRQQQRTTTQQQQKSQAQANRNKKQRKRVQSNQGPWALVGGILLIIAVVIGIFFWISSQQSSTAVKPTPTSSNVLNQVTNVNPTTLDAVGTGGIQTPPQALKSQPALTGPTGKPEFFYEGAEYCPYCAAQRWPVVVALSRFGTFTRLDQTASASDDVYPNTPTFTFYNSQYSSQYIDFVSLEVQTNQKDSTGNYATLQTPTADQQQLVSKYNTSGGIPFIDIGNKYIVQGVMGASGYTPGSLDNYSVADIANLLSDQNSSITQSILGAANYLTASICMTTQQQPGAVCTSSAIQKIEQSLGATSSINGGALASFASATPFDVVLRQQD